MKLLHTSDWHLGRSIVNGMSYGDNQKKVIDEICKIAVNEKVDGILLAGDVFDRSVASTEALQMYDDIITHICVTLDIPVYMIAGNHDGAERLSQCNELLKKGGLYIAGSLRNTPYVVNIGDVDIYLLPWISTEKVKAVYPEKAQDINSLEEAYKVVLDEYRANFAAGHKNILVSHAFIASAETSTSDKSAEVGQATMVGSFVFEGFDYVALGHLHGPQQINERIRYSGTPMAYSFGKEEKQTKSVTIIDTDTMSQTIVPILQPVLRNTLVGTYEELIKADYPKEVVDGYVKLDVTDIYVGLEAYTSLREVYKNLIEIKGKSLEKDDGKITMTIEEYEKLEQNPEEVFKKYCEDIMSESPSEHLMSLFKQAVESYEKGVIER